MQGFTLVNYVCFYALPTEDETLSCDEGCRFHLLREREFSPVQQLCYLSAGYMKVVEFSE